MAAPEEKQSKLIELSHKVQFEETRSVQFSSTLLMLVVLRCSC